MEIYWLFRLCHVRLQSLISFKTDFVLRCPPHALPTAFIETLMTAHGSSAANGSLPFTRLDAGLPLNRGTFSGLDHRWIPIPDGLNQYLLKIEHLPAGKYSIEADGRLVHTADADELVRGINMAHMTPDAWHPGGPWNVQSDIVKELVDARDKLLQGQRVEQAYESTRFLTPAGAETYQGLDAHLIQLQRQTARPRPYHFEIKRIGDE